LAVVFLLGAWMVSGQSDHKSAADNKKPETDE